MYLSGEVRAQRGDTTVTAHCGGGEGGASSGAAPSADEDAVAEAKALVAALARADLRLKVLVVDDDPFHQLRARTVFTAFGCAVAVADTGRAALDACATQAFHLIILDRHMPIAGGNETVRRLRARSGPSRDAFVACCSIDPPPDLSAGYDMIAPKPLTPAACANLLKAAVSRSFAWAVLAGFLRPLDRP